MTKKILIVDDEPDILEFISYNLKKQGHEVFTANNGELGLQSALNNKPDLIISDILMPVMNGIVMCRKMREKIELSETPFIFLSATNDDYQVLSAMDAGATHYVSKPISILALLNMVKELLNKPLHT